MMDHATCMFRSIQGGVMTVSIYTIKGTIIASSLLACVLAELTA